MSGKVFNEKCVITGATAKYRDPLTGLAYSDLAAFKVLREKFNAKDETILSLSESAKSTASQERAGEHEQEHEASGEPESTHECLLSSSQLLIIERDEEIKKLISDKQTAKLLMEIDGSVNPQRTLTQSRKDNPQVEEFVARVLSAIEGERR
ncbi:hypothetical protein GUITHDRAFT_165342 [Guillardia theta CCMP2712]|uniref:Vps72/YL1 C-terminal domain-containing protein n=2 Tax=Guillardia theta TaxID=55529 RepID=L1IPX2_GUITC|nr:hypothetical protein GUITHDRAFT_165342 [Guillardia theta CCMP2712]EKX37939.1 hypothetical protein GUITHDRAFT_165342 [Guillardia theta CCMP2712]|eukprot:XP_005824919.1 hypothetical protein GUITHDRAFT_165342 [Guillardia theta CCMP2712]